MNLWALFIFFLTKYSYSCNGVYAGPAAAALAMPASVPTALRSSAAGSACPMTPKQDDWRKAARRSTVVRGGGGSVEVGTEGSAAASIFGGREPFSTGWCHQLVLKDWGVGIMIYFSFNFVFSI